MAYGFVSVGTTPTLIVNANTARQSLIIINGGDDVLHIGEDANITALNCPYLLPNGNLTEDSGGTKLYCGAFYGITTGSTSTVYYWERER